MKLLIAYDGSEHANRAITELAHAGLPADVTAEVLTVADVFLPPREPREAPPPAVQQAHENARQAVADAERTAQMAAAMLREQHPGWSVSAHAVADSPAWGVIKRADETDVDLIVVGARGHGALQRLLLGSVSAAIVTEARCSVRVSRGRATERAKGDAVRVLVAVDSSSHAHRALETAAGRSWPEGSSGMVVTVIDGRLAGAVEADLGRARHFAELAESDDAEAWTARMTEDAAAMLEERGLPSQTTVLHGEPKGEILKLAEEWTADVIFVGARGLSLVERMLLGGMSRAVIARAPCSVEVVR